MMSPAVPPTVQIRQSVEKYHNPCTCISSAERVRLDFVPEESVAVLYSQTQEQGLVKMLQDKYVTSFYVTWIHDSWIHEFHEIHVFLEQNLQEEYILN